MVESSTSCSVSVPSAWRSVWGGRGIQLVVLALVSMVLQAQSEMRPKYGPQAVRLSESRDSLQPQGAPDFWTLIPYYLPQPDDHSCTITSVAMLINGLRAGQQLDGETELATTANVLKGLRDERLRFKSSAEGPGLSLDDVASMLPALLQSFQVGPATIEVHRFAGDHAAELQRLRRLLTVNEQSADDLLLANFLQSSLTGDPQGAVGHMAPVAAFDAARDRVLILDPDRRWYEPYWVPTETLLIGLRTCDVDNNQLRGLVRVARTTGL